MTQFGSQLTSGVPSPGSKEAKEVVVDASWAFSYISDGDPSRIAAVLDSRPLPALLQLLKLADSVSVVTPVLRTLGNVVTGTDEQTQSFVDAGGLDHCPRLLCCDKKQVKKETLWLLSNVLAGTSKQVEAVFAVKTAGLGLGMEHIIKKVVDMAREEQWEVRKEAVWCVANVCTGGSDMHVMTLVEFGAIQALCAIFAMTDSSLVLTSLEALSAILKVGAKAGKNYVRLVDECDGITLLENLQHHDDDAVYKKAVQVIEKYFGEEADGDDGGGGGDGSRLGGVAPAVNGNGTFDFGFKPQPVVSAAPTTFGGGGGGKGGPTLPMPGQNFNPNINAFGVQQYNF